MTSYTSGSMIAPVPIAQVPRTLPASMRGSAGARSLALRRPIGESSYVSEYVGDNAIAPIPTEYIGDGSDYDLVVGDYGPYVGEVPLAGCMRRRAVHAIALGDYDKLEGLSLKGIAKAVKKVASPVQKVAANVGHAVGKAATSSIGKVVIGGALALTGVGLPAAAALGAASQAGGKLISKGGNLKKAAGGAVEGAAIGAASSIAGKVARSGISKIVASRAPKALPSTTGDRLDMLSSGQIPGVSTLPTSVGPVSDLATAPLAVTAAPLVAAAVATKTGSAKRVSDSTAAASGKTAPKESQLSKNLKSAQKVLGVGSAAKKLADNAAKKIDDFAAQLTGRVTDTADQAANTLRGAGNAAEGATQGAVAGSGLGAVSDFIQNNKPLVFGGLALIGAAIVLPRLLPARSPSRAA